MQLSDSISRFTVFLKRNGPLATLRRAAVVVKRFLVSGNTVVFWCDLATHPTDAPALPSSLKLDRTRNEAEISPQDLHRMTIFWNPKLARRNIKERLQQGSSLWTLRFEGKLAAYGWTIQGHTIEPHYFRLVPEDVHLFDFLVFPEYRGQGLNPLLVNQILHKLAAESRGRAFIEVAEWNKAQLCSLKKTPFIRLGLARKTMIFGYTVLAWAPDRPVGQ